MRRTVNRLATTLNVTALNCTDAPVRSQRSQSLASIGKKGLGKLTQNGEPNLILHCSRTARSIGFLPVEKCDFHMPFSGITIAVQEHDRALLLVIVEIFGDLLHCWIQNALVRLLAPAEARTYGIG